MSLSSSPSRSLPQVLLLDLIAVREGPPHRTPPRHAPCYHDTMTKNLTVRLDDELAADTEALARAEGQSLNETVRQALVEAVERRRTDPEFKKRLRRIIEEDRELLERLAK
jgi:hypothetical protein